MTTNTVFRDSNGKTINIGPWDYMEIDTSTFNDDGSIDVSSKQSNPLPEGATSSEEEVQDDGNGGWIPTKDVTESSEDTSTTRSTSTS